MRRLDLKVLGISIVLNFSPDDDFSLSVDVIDRTVYTFLLLLSQVYHQAMRSLQRVLRQSIKRPRIRRVTSSCRYSRPYQKLSLGSVTIPARLHTYAQKLKEESSNISNIKAVSSLACASCGIPLQTKDPDSPGFYKDPTKHNRSIRKSEDNYFTDVRQKIMMEKLESLEGNKVAMKKPTKKSDDRLMCQRCLDALRHSKFDLSDQKLVTVDEVLNEIPEDGTIVQVVSALDFPLGVNRKVSESRDPSKMWYIVTKIDAFFDVASSVSKTGSQYFKDSLAQLVKAMPEHVLVVSGKLGWETEKVLDKLPQRGKLYFVGSVNSGKSTLVRTLLYRDDIRLTSKDYYGPGRSEIPGFTATQIPYPLVKHKSMTIIDTPGFSPSNRGVYRYILNEDVKKASQVVKFASANHSRHKLLTPNFKGSKLFSGEKLFSVGGFFYLKPPKGTVLKVFAGIPGQFAIYNSLERLKVLNETRNAELGHRFSVNKEAVRELIRYVIPPFYGQVDLVLRNVGYITIAPCGKFSGDELFEVLVPKGIDVIVREGIFQYIYRTKGTTDRTGNRLAKRNRAKKGSIVLNEVPKNKLIFTSLYEVPMSVSREEAKELVAPKSMFSHEEEHYTSQKQYPNTLWRNPELL